MLEKEEYIETSFGEFMQLEYLEELNMTEEGLAKALNLNLNKIHNIIHDKEKLDAQTDLRLCKYFNKSDGFFMRMQNSIDMVMARNKFKIELGAIIPFDYKEHQKHIKA